MSTKTNRILIVGGTLIDPSIGKNGEFDILIEQGKIEAIEKPGSLSNLKDVEKIDAAGMWIAPGFIDLHVHLREPGYEWKETIATGSQAAVLGGYTGICCMPNTRPVNDNAEITRFIMEKAKASREGVEDRASDAIFKGARVYPIGAISQRLEGKEMAPFSEMRKAGCIAFSDDGEPVYDSGLMRRALEWCLMLDVPLCCHEEDKCLSAGGCMNESKRSYRLGLKGWPKVAEEVMIARDIELSRVTKAKVHFCHVTTARGVELIRRAKNDGIPVSAEVTPHHLMFTEEQVEGYDTNAKMSPPLREAEDVAALRAGLKDGTIDMIASDHAPHERDTKEVEFDRASFGILGLQTSLSVAIELINEGHINQTQAIELMSHTPAKRFGLPGGTLKKGSPADIAIIDPTHRWNFSKEQIRSISKNSPFLNKDLTGAADTVLIDGEVVVKKRNLVAV